MGELDNVTPEDAGEWKCELESYHAGRYRGYGYLKTGVMEISVPTTTTTTTTTTKVITTNGETKTTSLEQEITEGSDPVEAGTPSEGQNSDLNDEPASNAGY